MIKQTERIIRRCLSVPQSVDARRDLILNQRPHYTRSSRRVKSTHGQRLCVVMKARLVPNCNRALANAAAEKGFRLNGRVPQQFRDCEMTFGKSYGSCEVILHPGTHVFTQISCSIGEPMDSRPGEGIMTVSVWISPSATGEMGGGGSGSQKPALIARTIERLFKEHRVVDLESLCIKFGERVWVLRVDVHIYDTNGCLAEAAALSVLGGLLTFQRPQAYVDVNTDKLVVHGLDDATPVRLHLHHLPVLTSFALTEGGLFLAEPDQDEEEIFPGKLLVGINDSKELCYLHLTNPIDHDVLTESTRLAETKCLERINWIKELVAEDDKIRSVPVYLKKDSPRSAGIVVDVSSLIPPAIKTLSSNEQRMGKLSIAGSTSKKQKLKPIPADQIVML